MPSRSSWSECPTLDTSPSCVSSLPPLTPASQSISSPGFRSPEPSDAPVLWPLFTRSAKTLPPADTNSCTPRLATTVARKWARRALPSSLTLLAANVPSGSVAARTATRRPTATRLNAPRARTVRTTPFLDAVTNACRPRFLRDHDTAERGRAGGGRKREGEGCNRCGSEQKDSFHADV